jgi:hypothetical protein
MLLSVKDMVSLDVRKIPEGSTVQVYSIPDKDGKRQLMSLDTADLVRTFYIEAVSLVEFMIRSYGASAFTDFCRKLRDGGSLEGALQTAYSTHLSGLQDLESEWLKYVTNEEGVW